MLLEVPGKGPNTPNDLDSGFEKSGEPSRRHDPHEKDGPLDRRRKTTGEVIPELTKAAMTVQKQKPHASEVTGPTLKRHTTDENKKIKLNQHTAEGNPHIGEVNKHIRDQNKHGGEEEDRTQQMKQQNGQTSLSSNAAYASISPVHTRPGTRGEKEVFCFWVKRADGSEGSVSINMNKPLRTA